MNKSICQIDPHTHTPLPTLYFQATDSVYGDNGMETTGLNLAWLGRGRFMSEKLVNYYQGDGL